MEIRQFKGRKSLCSEGISLYDVEREPKNTQTRPAKNGEWPSPSTGLISPGMSFAITRDSGFGRVGRRQRLHRPINRVPAQKRNGSWPDRFRVIYGNGPKGSVLSGRESHHSGGTLRGIQIGHWFTIQSAIIRLGA